MSPEHKEFIKTPLMSQKEFSFCEKGQSIRDLLEQEYIGRKKSATKLAASLRVSPDSIIKWIKIFEIPIRTSSEAANEIWADAEFKQNMKKAAKKSWQNEDTKPARVAAMHNDKQKQSIQDGWDKLSIEERNLRLANAHEAYKRKNTERMIARLGEDPEQALKSFKERGYSTAEIAAEVRAKPWVIYNWLKKCEGAAKKATTLKHETIESRQDLIKRAKEADLMQYLLPKDRSVLEMRLGASGRIATLEEVAQKLSITKEGVRQKEGHALIVLGKLLSGEPVLRKSVASLPKA